MDQETTATGVEATATRTTGALIVGGGPAGLAAAIALRQRGIDCMVVEARPAGIDKACGEGLMPDSRAVLARLGVVLTAADGQLFSGIRFANASHSVDARFSDGEGIGVRRPHLHALLAARAEALGARLLWNSRVQLAARPANGSSICGEGAMQTAQVNGRPVRYRWLIGADGQASTVRRWAGLDSARRQSQRYGFRTHYRVNPARVNPTQADAAHANPARIDAAAEFDRVEIHWARGGQLYLTPVAPDCVCVVYLSRDPQRGKSDVLSEFPEVVRRLAGSNGVEAVSDQRGAVSSTCLLRRVATEDVALIGDASGSADSITGEGLAVSFRQALALADAIAAGSLAPYKRAHREIARLPHAMGTLMLTLDRWPRLEVRAMRAMAGTPAVFRELLEAHVGKRSLAAVLLRRGPRLGWSLLAGGSSA